MSKPTAQLYGSMVALQAVAVTLVARSATWPATALLQTWEADHHRNNLKVIKVLPLVVVVVAAMVDSAQVTVSPTIGLPHATNVVDLTTTLEIVKLKP